MVRKRCTKCSKEFSATVEFFPKQKGGKYGLASWCKDCRYTYNKFIRDSNKEKNKNKTFNEAILKECNKCNSMFSATPEYFNMLCHSRDGLSYVCKFCYNKQQRDRSKGITNRKYVHSDKAKLIRQRSNYKIKYGISLEHFIELAEQQNNACSICGTSNPGGRWKKLNIDHDHKTGKIRGLLCLKCNKLLERVISPVFEFI